MCGVPVHAAETYLQRLIKKGFRVAVCEQTEESVLRRKKTRIKIRGAAGNRQDRHARYTHRRRPFLMRAVRIFILSLYRSHAGDTAIAWADVF